MERCREDVQRSWQSFLNDFERDTVAEDAARERANPPATEWEKLYEMWGACSIPPWPHTWQEYHRLYFGWRRHRWEMTAELASMIANGPLHRKDGTLWQPHELCHLLLPPVKWIRKKKKREGDDDACQQAR